MGVTLTLFAAALLALIVVACLAVAGYRKLDENLKALGTCLTLD
jgi:hypothetical protein